MKYKIITLIIMLFCIGLPSLALNETEAKLEYNKGIDYYKTGQYDKSISAFRKAIDLNPDLIDAYYNLGSILTYLGQDEAALTVFKQIVVRKPDDYESVYRAAELSQKLGQYDKAKSMLALIPAGSNMSIKAQELAKIMNSDMQTIREEQNITDETKIPTSNGIYNDISSPTGITTDNNGNLYVAGYSDNVIFKITPDGNRIIYIKNNKLSGPIGLISDKNGNLYIANYNANNVLKVDNNGKITILLDNVPKPYGLHISNNVLFISSQGENAVIRYKL